MFIEEPAKRHQEHQTVMVGKGTDGAMSRHQCQSERMYGHTWELAVGLAVAGLCLLGTEYSLPSLLGFCTICGNAPTSQAYQHN